MDFTYINQMRALLVEKGNQFFENVKKGLPELGVDITDPIQVLLAVRRLGGPKLEEMFHPGERNVSMPRGISPFLPTSLMRRTTKLIDEIIKRIHSEQFASAVRGKCIVTASTDGHEHGLYVINGILKNLGANVISGGAELDAEEVLGIAAKAATHYIALSTHNGLCLDFGKHLMAMAKQRNQHVEVFMGGRLNGIVEGCTEPIDVSDRLAELGIRPCKDVEDLIKGIVAVEV
jgi:methylmalonyl-CoA mutase cobalamin-binding subunit